MNQALRACLVVVVLAWLPAGVAAQDMWGPPELIRRLQQHPLGSARADAVEALARLGNDAPPEAVSALLVAMTDDDTDVRRAAVQALRSVPVDAELAQPVMAEALNDTDWMVREAAAGAFADFGAVPKETLDTVMATLDNANWEVRYAGALAIASLAAGNEIGIEKLVTLLAKDDHWEVRSAVASALGRFGPRASTAIPDLIAAIQFDTPEVIESAVQALGGYRSRRGSTIGGGIAGFLPAGALERRSGPGADRQRCRRSGRCAGAGAAGPR